MFLRKCHLVRGLPTAQSRTRPLGISVINGGTLEKRLIHSTVMAVSEHRFIYYTFLSVNESFNEVSTMRYRPTSLLFLCSAYFHNYMFSIMKLLFIWQPSTMQNKLHRQKVVTVPLRQLKLSCLCNSTLTDILMQ